jgi:hypothetical protein
MASLHAPATPHSSHHDTIRGIDIIKATRKPTKGDHFRTMLAHNFKVTLRDPSVYVFGAVIPLIMIGVAIGIVSRLSNTIRVCPCWLSLFQAVVGNMQGT